MAYDETLAERVRGLLAKRRDVTEKRMFGGIAFMVGGHMSVGVVGDDLMVRVGPEKYDALVKQTHARPMDFTGKPMKGFVYVAGPALESYLKLERWMNHGLAFADSLPPKDEAAPLRQRRKPAAPKAEAASRPQRRKPATPRGKR